MVGVNLGARDERSASGPRYIEFGAHLRHCREAAGLSRKDVVGRLRLARMKLSDSAYAKWEDGTNRPNEYAVVVVLADVLKLAPFTDDRFQLFWLAGEWTERVDAGHGLPGSRCPRLVGRTELIDDVVGQLRSSTGPRVILLAALGGYGKTELARYVAQRLLHWKEFVDVAWLDLRTHEFDFTHQTNRLAEAAVEASSVATIVRWFSLRLGCHTATELATRLRNQPILLVLDNLDTLRADQRESVVSRLHELLGEGRSRALVTSRYDIVPPYVYRPKIDGLSLAATRELLDSARHSSPRPLALQRASDDDVAIIWRLTRGSPLAIQLVIGQSQHFDLPQIIHGLRRAQTESRTDDGLYAYLYRQSWDELSPPARTLLIYLAAATRSNQSDDQLVGVSPAGVHFDPRTLSSTMAELLRWFLIERTSFGGSDTTCTYALHPLTRAFVLSQRLRAVWERECDEVLVRGAATRKHQEIFERALAPDSVSASVDVKAFDTLARAIPDCLEGMRYYLAHGDCQRVLWYWRWLSGYLWMYGRYHEYVECDQYALVAAKMLALTDAVAGRRLEGVISAELAFALLEFNDLDAAEQHARRAEELFRSLEHAFDVATALRYRATIAVCRPDLDLAETLCRQALQILEDSTNGQTDGSTTTRRVTTTRLDLVIHSVPEQQVQGALSTLHNLMGDIYRQRGDYRSARRAFVSALVLTRSFRGGARAYRSLAPLRNLGHLYEVSSDRRKAKTYYNRCLTLSADGTQPDVRASVLSRLARLAAGEGDTARAKCLAKEAVSILQPLVYSADRDDVLRILEDAATSETSS